MRRLLVCALLLAGCSTPALSTTPTTNPGQHGWQYVVASDNQGIIVYEGTYPHAVAWAHSHHQAMTIYQLPKGKARCQPAKKVCLVP